MNRQRVGQTYTDYLRKSSAKLAIFKFRAYHSSLIGHMARSVHISHRAQG